MYLRRFCLSKVHGNFHVPSPFLLIKGTREFPCTFAVSAYQKEHGNFHVLSPFVLLKGTLEFPRPFAICATERYTEISLYFNTEAR